MHSDIESRVTRKLAWRIIPFVMLLYFVSFLDRVNVGFAAMTMNKAIGLSSTSFGLGGGLFFIGYFKFEVPSNWIHHRVGARIWIARVMITWGIVSAASAFAAAGSSAWPPMIDKASPETLIRGPGKRPSPTASRTAITALVGPPRSRTVVKPARAISSACVRPSVVA